MDDNDLQSYLRTLRPRRAPAGMGHSILARAAALARARRRRAARSLGWMAACAAALLLAFALLATGPPGREGGGAGEMVRATTETGERALSNGLEAERILLEARLSRLRSQARQLERSTPYLLELDAIEEELEAMDEPSPPNSSPAEGEKRSWIPTPRGDYRHA